MTTLHRQPVSVARRTLQHVSVGYGGSSPWTAGKHSDKEDAVLEHALGGLAATTPSVTRTITDTSASNIFALVLVTIFVEDERNEAIAWAQLELYT